MLFSLEIETLARLVIDDARERNLRIVTAESCTGGLVAGRAPAPLPARFGRLRARVRLLFQPRQAGSNWALAGDMIADLGAVSEPIVRIMAAGALENSHAHVSVAITGVAGPGGGTPLKPVGTVHFATARANQSVFHRQEFFELDGREEIQLAAVQVALEMLKDRIGERRS